jgi:cytochrome c oxidase subunit 3
MTNLTRSNFQAHPFHLVSPSPWPIFTSISLLTLTTTGVLTMHGFSNANTFLMFAFVSVVLSMSLWWRDVISEGTYIGNHTLAVQRGLNMGVALFIVSEILFFLAIFWAFFHSALSPTVELGAQWPPMGIEAINPFELPLLNTVILLSSGVTVTYAHHSLIQGNRSGALYGLVATVILAIVFTLLQGIEYTVSSFTISDGAFGSCFYFSTGFHGLIRGNLPLLNFKYSTLMKSKLCPNWISGFADAESSFSLRISKNNDRKTGWRVSPIFNIELHGRDVLLLEVIKKFFGVGSVITRKNGKVTYSVQSFSDLTHVIIPHFQTYPLLTKKRADFILFTRAVRLLSNNAQSTREGLKLIVNIRASMNKGLSDELKKSFPDYIPVDRPAFIVESVYHPNWLVGFVDGEGCFYVKVTKRSLSLVSQVTLSFALSQHSRDELLFKVIQDYLGYGIIEKVKTRPDAVVFVVYKFSDIYSTVIPFFRRYPLQGVKLLDFNDFCVIANLVKNKEHLTIEGVEKIKNIKSQMNSGRINK